MIDDEFKRLAESLLSCYEKAYEIYQNEVEYIINNKIKDINYIERTLDYILSIYTEKGFNLFIKLLLYYRLVNYENAKAYLEILKEEREEEYTEFIKKLIIKR